MKTLIYPQIDNIDLWDKIVSHKHQPTKNQLLRIRDKVVARYNYYSEHYDTLDEILPLPSEEWSGVKDALISCYGDNVEFKRVRQQQFSSLSATDKTKCPYCLLSRPSTLDHYFDKNDYPEFSVFIPNLVPCCSECNNIKSTTTFDVNNNRVFLHFYHDHIPEEQFLFVRFSGTNPDAVPVISIGLRFGEENYYSSLLQRHFTILSLISKYRNAILDRIAPILEEIRMYKEIGTSSENIKASLQIKHISLANHYGHNYWETCIYEGILNSPGFLEQILSA